jgi:two-component system, OmpR family, catabolic regulation response regulator CreB
VVEDEPAIADSVIYALTTEGFETAWCATGREALAELGKGRVDLVVLDIGLPDRNGFDLCRDIRRTSPVPIIFLTARKEEVDRIVGLEIGADDYIVKPFSPREVSARVRAVLRRSRPAVSPAPKLTPSSSFVVDPDRYAIAYRGKPLDLSRYEFRILRLLIENPGRVLSREQIMERAWEEPEASLDRTVDTHIKTLRAKLHAIRSKPDPIRTHRGLGYSLREDL